jgi:hypothetical protein
MNKYLYRQSLLISSVVGVLLLVGCGGEQEAEGYSESEYESLPQATNTQEDLDFERNDSFAGNMNLSNGALHGQVGTVFVHENAAATDGYQEQGLTIIFISAETDQSLFAMTMLEFHGGLSDFDLAAGESVTYNIYDKYEVTNGETFVQVVGCSGEDPSDWEYDESAQSVTLLVEEGDLEGHMTYQYTARFVDALGVEALVTGEFDWAP